MIESYRQYIKLKAKEVGAAREPAYARFVEPQYARIVVPAYARIDFTG